MLEFLTEQFRSILRTGTPKQVKSCAQSGEGEGMSPVWWLSLTAKLKPNGTGRRKNPRWRQWPSYLFFCCLSCTLINLRHSEPVALSLRILCLWALKVCKLQDTNSNRNSIGENRNSWSPTDGFMETYELKRKWRFTRWNQNNRLEPCLCFSSKVLSGATATERTCPILASFLYSLKYCFGLLI